MQSNVKQLTQPFLIADTEGREELKEIAIADSHGIVIYEAFSETHPENDTIRLHRFPLREILIRFFKLAKGNNIIFHNAQHDVSVLQNSCKRVGLEWENISIQCTYKLAQKYFPTLNSYSLSHLSRTLGLKVRGRYFNPQQAHTAKYDVEFTYQLYQRIMMHQLNQNILPILRQKPNPFSHNRVDTPFQNYPDLTHINAHQFTLLTTIISDIRQDYNHQSKGVVITGEAGSGKTHLMMRLAKEVLAINRVLFIRQPNNANSVLYHIYNRILESFFERVADAKTGGEYTQIENLLAHSFVKLVSRSRHLKLTKRDQDILLSVQENHLNIYARMSQEETRVQGEYWQHIERRIQEWWLDQYGIGGYAPKIISGIVKFCRYRRSDYRKIVIRWLTANELEPEDADRVDLPNWEHDLSREEFSLQAIAVFSKLSLLDEPLIIIFDQLEGLGLPSNRDILLSFGHAIKEIFTHVPNSLIIFNLFPDRWQQFQEIFANDRAIVDRMAQQHIVLSRPSEQDLTNVLNLYLSPIGLSLHEIFTEEEQQFIMQGSSIRDVINRASNCYQYRVHIGRSYISELQNSAQLIINEKNDLNQLIAQEVSPPSEQLPQDPLHRIEQLEKEVEHIKTLMLQLTTHALQWSEEIQRSLLSNSPLSLQNNSSQNDIPIFHPKHREGVKVDSYIRQYLTAQTARIREEYSNHQIITDSDDIGKLQTILSTFDSVCPVTIEHLRLGKRILPEHLAIGNRQVIGFLHVNGSSFTSRIKNYCELSVEHPKLQFKLWRDERCREITGKMGLEYIAQLNHAKNGQFDVMDPDNRITFELLYQLTVDLQNRDIEAPLGKIIDVLKQDMSDYWLIQAILPTR